MRVGWLFVLSCSSLACARSGLSAFDEGEQPPSGGVTARGGAPAGGTGVGASPAGGARTGGAPTGGAFTGGAPAGGTPSGGTAGSGAGSGGSGGRPLQPDDGCSVDGFCQVSPELTADWLFDVWGSGPRDVWAVGNSGTIVHYDGEHWTRIASGTEADLRGVSGTSPDDVWFVGERGTVIHYDGFGLDATRPPYTELDLRDVQATRDRVWFVAGAIEYPRSVDGYGVVFQVYPGGWGAVQPSEAGLDYRAAWVTSAAELWLTGDRTLYSDGLSFVDRGISPGNGIWSDGLEAWVTSLSNVYHSDYPDIVETSLDLGSSVTLFGIWGTSRNDLWVVGGDGVIGHSDGSAWTVAQITNAHLQAVWGTSANDVWAVGSNGTILHFDGAWSRSPSSPDPGASYNGIWGASDDAQWIVGNSGISAYDGDGDVRLATVMGGTGAGYGAIWGTAASDVVAVGGNGRIAEFDGGAWRDVPSPTLESIIAVWGHSERMVGICSGHVGIERASGGTWENFALQGGAGAPLEAIWGSSDDDFWVASPFSGVLGHHVADGWLAPDTNAFMSAMWGSSRDDIWGAGFGAVYHYDGETWERVTLDDGVELEAITGCSPTEVWAAGKRGVLYRYDGRDWATRDSGTEVDLHGVRCSSGGVWIVGSAGVILRKVSR